MAYDKNAVALNWIMNLIISIFLVVSYTMTVGILKTDDKQALDVFGFIRGSAIFLIPCAIEGVNIIINSTGKKAYVDKMEFWISVASLIIGAYLVYSTFACKNCVPLWVIQILLLIYPAKYIINFFDGLIDLARHR